MASRPHLSKLTRRRLQNFKANRRGYWSLWIFAALMLLMMIPGFLFGVAQGMCLPYAQAGAMQVDPSLAGSASGAVVFFQLFCAGMGELAVGLLADGTLLPVIIVMLGFALAALTAAIVAARSQATVSEKR